MTASFLRSRSSRTALIVLLLLVSLATASMILLQAQYSDAYRRGTAVSVLHDYSSLVADEVIRRSAADVGYYGYYPLVGALVYEVQQSGNLSEATRANLLSTQDARLKRAAGLVKGYFQMDLLSGRLTFFEEEPQEETPSWLRQGLIGMSAQGGDNNGKLLHSPAGEPPRTFVAAATRGPDGRDKVIGFEANLPALTEWFGTALNRQPLVPPSLGHGRVSNAFVFVSIRDQGGVERYRMGDGPSQGWAVTKPFSDAYQGVLSGFTVEASISDQVSRHVVIGGVPNSRLPLFLGLFALNAGMIVTAILQLRREMALQQLRDEFVSSVSHELRTPLTQIRMFAETLLLDRVRSSDEHRRSLEIIDREARRLTQLVENILQFSRAERKVDLLAKEKRELAPLVQEIVDDFESVIDGDQTRFECCLGDGITASVDPDAFRQIVINLLDNAVKYGRKPERVIVALEAREGMAVLTVDDEGPGIPPAERNRVFEQFYRLERDRRSAVAGTGIGLSIVRDLVSRHGERCLVTTGDRGGAKFIIEMPLCPAEKDARAYVPEKQPEASP